jgi:hypothetical protein
MRLTMPSRYAKKPSSPACDAGLVGTGTILDRPDIVAGGPARGGEAEQHIFARADLAPGGKAEARGQRHCVPRLVRRQQIEPVQDVDLAIAAADMCLEAASEGKLANILAPDAVDAIGLMRLAFEQALNLFGGREDIVIDAKDGAISAVGSKLEAEARTAVAPGLHKLDPLKIERWQIGLRSRIVDQNDIDRWANRPRNLDLARHIERTRVIGQIDGPFSAALD